jgi:hypothetical protein
MIVNEMIGLYGKYVFKGSTRMWSNTTVEYLGIWEGSEQEFLQTYHFKYPNERLQIYKHKYKPLSRALREKIDVFIKTDPWFIQQNRNEKLDDLLS